MVQFEVLMYTFLITVLLYLLNWYLIVSCVYDPELFE